MRLGFGVLFIFLGFLLQSCEGELFLSIDEKLEGRWYFDKVTYTKPFSILNTNVTDDFEGDTVEFSLNGDADYFETNPNRIYTGTWDIRSYYSYANSDDGEYVDVLEITVVDFQNNDFLNYDWEIETLTRNRIVARERIGNRTYRYRLKKQ